MEEVTERYETLVENHPLEGEYDEKAVFSSGRAYLEVYRNPEEVLVLWESLSDPREIFQTVDGLYRLRKLEFFEPYHEPSGVRPRGIRGEEVHWPELKTKDFEDYIRAEARTASFEIDWSSTEGVSTGEISIRNRPEKDRELFPDNSVHFQPVIDIHSRLTTGEVREEDTRRMVSDIRDYLDEPLNFLGR